MKASKFFASLPTGKTITLDGNYPSDTIDTIKNKICDKEGIPLPSQLLFHGKKCLEDKCTISMYNIKSESTIYLKLPMRGGGRKRKRQNADKTDYKHSQMKKVNNVLFSRHLKRVGNLAVGIDCCELHTGNELPNAGKPKEEIIVINLKEKCY